MVGCVGVFDRLYSFEREGEREDATAEEKGGPEQLSNDVA